MPRPPQPPRPPPPAAEEPGAEARWRPGGEAPLRSAARARITVNSLESLIFGEKDATIQYYLIHFGNVRSLGSECGLLRS